MEEHLQRAGKGTKNILPPLDRTVARVLASICEHQGGFLKGAPRATVIERLVTDISAVASVTPTVNERLSSRPIVSQDTAPQQEEVSGHSPRFSLASGSAGYAQTPPCAAFGCPRADMALNPPGRWSFFLSHAQRSGRATTIAERLAVDLDDVWFDVKMSDKSGAVMKEGVQNSIVVIAILTDDGDSGNAYFERPFCPSELRWAQEAGVFIQPVVAADDKQRIGELSRIEKLRALGPQAKNGYC